MHHRHITRLVLSPVAIAALVACGDPSPKASTPTAQASGAHGHEHAKQPETHGGPVIELGTATIGAFSVKATRDQGLIVAGKDAPIDVTVATAAGGTAKVVGVRFWVGLEDAKGSVKAKADIENPKEPNRWHTHAEIPNPIPSGSQLWVEIESDAGDPAKGSFGLKE